jgi:putative nucleotidyltransferase with HDIG domain
MAKILVVEDDDFFRDAISDYLTSKKYDVTKAANGKVARDVMSVESFDVVITDIQMPGLTGIELLEWSKVHSPTPFVVMTGFSMLLETQSAYEMGAKEFLNKPFKNIELVRALDRILGVQKIVDTVPQHNEYCKVSIEEFIARPRTDFDIFIRLSDLKYIKLANQGEEISKERTAHFKEKGVKYLYILKEDFSKLVKFNLKISQIIKNRDDIPSVKKLNFLKYTGEVILEKAFVKGVDKESFLDAQNYLSMTLEVISEADEYFDLLELLNSHSDFIYAHSIGVSMFSIMIARKLGFEASSTFTKLSVAGMFHDIGKKEIDRDLLEKPRHLLTTHERKIIESHVNRSKEILLGIRTVPEGIIQMVSEHHEDIIGQGYPANKTKRDFHPLSPILQCANLFADQALTSPNHKGLSGPEAVVYLSKVYRDKIDSTCLAALKKLFTES